MTRTMRIAALVLAIGGASLLAGCGSEPPAPGDLIITSEPPGATIALDGQSTDTVTPYTFTELETGLTYNVTVSLEGWNPVEARAIYLPPAGSATADFSLTQGTGSLSVTSDPEGAAIVIDGQPSGEITPHTFEDLLPGDYEVRVEQTGYVGLPRSMVATVVAYGVATAEFEVLPLPDRVVLLEGFSNVYCVGCPTMNGNVDALMHTPGYGRDRLLFVKWPALLSPLDPFYWVTQSITNARVSWYFDGSQISLPTLEGDGSLLGTQGLPPNLNGIKAFVDGQPAFAEVGIAVTTDEDLGDVADLSHQATVTLSSPGGIDLAGHELHVVLVYESVETENEGYIDGITEFHWVMRDHAVPTSDIGALDPGIPYPFDLTLTDPLGGELDGHAVYPDNKQIIAWIQHATTRAVIQAGSTATAAADLAADSPANPDATHVLLSGGSR